MLIFIILFSLINSPAVWPQYRIDGSGEALPAEEEGITQTLRFENPSSLPTYVALAPNINDFGRFADGGSDSNWYVGFNNAWIVKLPGVATRGYQRAYIGAKLGRAKAKAKPNNPWELSVVPGKVYMAISPKPAFAPGKEFFLVESKDLPLQPDANVHMPGTGASQWFWAEVPIHLVNSSGPNYLIIWSPAREFRDAASSPILAAMEAAPGDSAAEPVAWNNHSLQGVPPRSAEGALQVPIRLKPALAIKLAPPARGKVVVDSFASQSLADDLLLQFSVEGRDVDLAWIELSQDELEWDRVSPYLRRPPYVLTLPRTVLPARGGYLRAKARDLLGAEGHSKTIFITTHGSR